MNVLSEEVRREFWDAWNGLSEVHTQEDLDTQSAKMWAARKRLMKVDPEFRAMIKDREDEANEDADVHRAQIEAKHKLVRSEAEKEVAAAITKAKATLRLSDEDLEEWAQKHRFKVVTPKEAKTKSALICPICHGPDRGNTVNGEPACLKCRHKLVPHEDLSKYNRAYRRNWKKRRG